MLQNAHQIESSEVLRRLDTRLDSGLTPDEATRRLRAHGPNLLKQQGGRSPWLIVWEQLTASMVLILIAAAVVSLALGDIKNAVAIAVIVGLNGFLGFLQEYKAEKAIAALKKLATPQARVRRGGKILTLSSAELVPGDIVWVEAGNYIPADGRIIESANLRVQESALTGESEPVEKSSGVVPEGLAIADRSNMVYMGTLATYGRAQVAVVTTGMRTEIGQIAVLLQQTDKHWTPLQKRLNRLGGQLAVIALVLVGIIFGLGLLRGEEPELMFMTAVSLAVAAIPEGLPAVVTIALALGAQRMLKRKALIRKLPAVETLGSVTVICSDKTGTLTQNQMTVSALQVAGAGPFDAAAAGPTDEALKEYPALRMTLAAGALCNDATETTGDPTETALIAAAARFGFLKESLERTHPRRAEIPFDSDRKRMSTLHELREGELAGLLRSHAAILTKGAVENLLGICSQIWVKDRAEALTESWQTQIRESANRMANDGMRVLGVAFRGIDWTPDGPPDDSWERSLTFVGLIGMMDPARPEAREAVQMCKRAGIRPVMITGDHPLTAQRIGRQIGLEPDSIFARVAPQDKLRIIQDLQKRGQIVAMTGDGVNDAPALKKADIGIAMGITGTDVSKEAAHMVLLDDNFATIVAAVEEGRVIFDNIRKFVKYLMTTNSAEIAVMLFAPFCGMPLPLLPLQILWINLVSDGPAALAIGVEPAERNVMDRPPHPASANIFDRNMGRHILVMGFLMSVVALGTGYLYWRAGRAEWQTMIFTILALSQLGHALAIRSNRYSLFQIGLLSNKPLLISVLAATFLQITAIYAPALQAIFKTMSLEPCDLVLAVAMSGIVFAAVEIEKHFLRRPKGNRE